MVVNKENKNPLVSIILITYNRQQLLKETIDSILSQTYSNFELIVVDNYSDYDFFGWMESFHSDKIKAYQNQNNGTIAINRNFGIERARGEFLAFCDDDDLWYPKKLEIQMDYLTNHDVDMVSSARMLFGDGVKKEHVFFRKYDSKYKVFLYNALAPSTVVVRNSEDVRFDENPDFNCSEDWALWTKLIVLGYKLYQVPEPLIRYRVFASNLTKKNKVQPDFKSIRILTKLRRNFPKDFALHYYIIAVIYHFLKGCVRETLKLIKR